MNRVITVAFNLLKMNSVSVKITLIILAVAITLTRSAGDGTIKVFVLAGQSNMEGFGLHGSPNEEGTLDWVMNNEALKDTFPSLIDDNGDWVVIDNDGNYIEREDVWIFYRRVAADVEKKGGLSADFGFHDDKIGPEFGFGHVMGEFFDEQVLIVKVAMGGRSLYNDYLPPSSEDYPIPREDGDKGFWYKRILDDVEYVIGNLSEFYPDYNGEDYKIIGFGWHQGWNDGQSEEIANLYEDNMVLFTEDIRRDLSDNFTADSGMPFVLAVSGFNGYEIVSDRWQNRLATIVVPAQFAAADRASNTVAVDSRAFYRTPDHSPRDAVYHWNHNAESYFAIGNAMGEAMQELLTVEGCMDSSYEEYDPGANVHDSSACETLGLKREGSGTGTGSAFFHLPLEVEMLADGTHELALYSMAGEVLQRRVVKGKQVCRFSRPAGQGIYLLKVKTPAGTEIYKVVLR